MIGASIIEQAQSSGFDKPAEWTNAAAPQAALPGAFKVVAMLAAKEFGDRLRSGWVIGCVLVWLGAIGLTSFFGLLQIGQIGLQGYERTVISLLNLVQYLFLCWVCYWGTTWLSARKKHEPWPWFSRRA